MRWTLAVVIGVVGCAQPKLAGVEGGARVEPRAVEVNAYVGFPVERGVFVTGTGRARSAVEVRTSGGLTLGTPAAFGLTGGERVEVKFRVEARTAGAIAESVQVVIDGVETGVAVGGQVRAVPACPEAAACRAMRFEPSTGACVDAVLEDGAPCAGSCLEAATCHGGVCRGTPASCDDGDACTADACGAAGCSHVAVACAPSTNPCQASGCDPVKGCVAVDVLDGTACGDNDCTTAHVCLAGQCQLVTAPEGSVCRAGTPCASEGRCAANACVSHPLRLTAAWELSDTAKVKHSLLGVVSPGGLVYGVERNDVGIHVVAWDSNGFERWRTPLYSEYWSTTALYDAQSGLLFLGSKTWARALDATTGSQKWFVDLSAEMPLGNATPTGAKQVYPIKMTLLPKAKRVVIAYSEGYESHVAWVFGLDQTTGQQAFKIRRDGHLYGLMTTATDELFLGSAGCWAPASWNAAYDAAGGAKWSVFQAGIPAVTTGTALYFQPYGSPANFIGRIDLQNGAMGQEMANGSSKAILADGAMLYVQGGNAPTALTAWDTATHQAKWSVSGVPLTQAFLTEGGGVLGLSSAEIVNLDDTGTTAWRCPFATPVVSPYGASVVGGKLVAQTGAGIAAFPVGAVKVSATGWSVSDRGTPERTQRAR